MKYLLLIVLSVLTGSASFAGSPFFKDIRVKQAEKLMLEHNGKGTLVILDVRSGGEFRKGWIEGAVNINFWGNDFADSVSLLDHNQAYLVYCTSGVRSTGAMKKMKELGFTRIYNMKGGMMAWRAARKKIVKGDA
jgi:rhodanese-related sulfurtransferase